jgi:hypothetical protein
LAVRGVDQYLQKNLFALPYSVGFAQDYLTSEYEQTLTVNRIVERPWYKNWLAWTGVGLGVVGAGVGGFFYAQGVDAQSKAQNSPWAQDKDNYNDDIERYNTLGHVSIIAGSTFLLSGVLGLILRKSTTEERVEPRVGPGITISASPNSISLEKRF